MECLRLPAAARSDAARACTRRAVARRPPRRSSTRTSLLLPPALVALPLFLVLRGEHQELRLERQRVLAAVVEEGRRGTDARVEPLLLVSLDDGVELPGVDLFEHGATVQPQLPGEGLELRVVQLLLVGEKTLAQLPELAALAGELGAAGGGLGAGMAGEGKML